MTVNDIGGGVDQSTIKQVEEGLLGILTLGIVGAVILVEPNNTGAMAVASGLAGSVITYWFSARQVERSTNGTLTAMLSAANRLSDAQLGAAATALQQSQPVSPTALDTTSLSRILDAAARANKSGG